MESKVTPCDPSLLNRSLADALSEMEETILEQHLTQCAVCREQLERLAGSGESWSGIVGALRAESAAIPEGAGSLETSAPVEGMDLGPSDSPIDFAVDFLDPAREADSLGRLGDIEIVELLGRGGMGIVLRGWQPELCRAVAVKVLAPHLASSGAARQRFAREAQAAAAVVHPNVMPIYAVNSNGKLPYLVMPYTRCESLQQRIDRQGALPAIDIVRIALQVAQALAAAHAQGLVHRDVKPANILLEPGTDRALLTDFGLARAADDASLTRTGVIAGTPQYMSPEQARGDAIDARSDLFSLGSVLYTACTGRPPFRADNSYGILRRITDSQPHPVRDLNPDVPAWLELLVNRLMQKRPDDRYAAAREVADLLQECLAHLQQPDAISLPAGLLPPVAQRPLTSYVRGFYSRGLIAILGVCAMLLFAAPRFVQPTPSGDAEARPAQLLPAQLRPERTQRSQTQSSQTQRSQTQTAPIRPTIPRAIDLSQTLPPPEITDQSPARLAEHVDGVSADELTTLRREFESEIQSLEAEIHALEAAMNSLLDAVE